MGFVSLLLGKAAWESFPVIRSFRGFEDKEPGLGEDDCDALGFTSLLFGKDAWESFALRRFIKGLLPPDLSALIIWEEGAGTVFRLGNMLPLRLGASKSLSVFFLPSVPACSVDSRGSLTAGSAFFGRFSATSSAVSPDTIPAEGLAFRGEDFPIAGLPNPFGLDLS